MFPHCVDPCVRFARHGIEERLNAIAETDCRFQPSQSIEDGQQYQIIQTHRNGAVSLIIRLVTSMEEVNAFA